MVDLATLAHPRDPLRLSHYCALWYLHCGDEPTLLSGTTELTRRYCAGDWVYWPLEFSYLYVQNTFWFLWIAFAVIGLYLLLWPDADSEQLIALDLVGVIYAIIAGSFWAAYIVFGQRARRVHPAHVTAYGLTIAAMIILPFGLISGGANMFNPNLLLFGLSIAVLSSALPYSLEVFALRILPAKTFSIMLSLEPAVGALAGIIILGEVLAAKQWLAILLVVCASAGCTATAVRNNRKDNTNKAAN